MKASTSSANSTDILNPNYYSHTNGFSKMYNNMVFNMTTASTTTKEFILKDRELTEGEKAIQTKFAIIVGVCFSTFLLFLLGYVTFMQLKKLRRLAIERRKTEENLEKPTLTRRTSMVGQGQKQVVIERRASTVNRKASSNSMGSNSNNPQQKLLRLSSSGHSFESKTLPGMDRLLPPSPLSPEENFSFSLYPAANDFFDTAIVKYGNKNYTNTLQKKGQISVELQDLSEKSTTEGSEGGASLLEGFTKRPMSSIGSEDEEEENKVEDTDDDIFQYTEEINYTI